MPTAAMNGQHVALALALLCASALAYQCPMSYWSFDNDLLSDQSGRFPLAVTSGTAALVPGAVGRAAGSTTATSILQTAPSRDVQIGNSGDWALMLWTRLAPTTSYLRFVETPRTAHHVPGFTLQLNLVMKEVHLAICGNAQAPGCLFLGTNQRTPDDRWHHYAASIDRTTGLGTFYFDGVAQPRSASACWDQPCMTPWGPRGGGDFSPLLATDIYRPEGTFALNLGIARVDEVMLFHRTLAPEEVALAANPATAAAYAAQCDARQPACYAPGRAGMENPPALLLGECRFASLDTFALSVRAPRVRTRSAVALSVGPCALDGQATEALDNCSDRVRGTRSWESLVRDCGVRLLASQGGADAVASAAGEADLVALGRVSVLPQGDASRVRLTFAASPEVFRAAQDSSSSMSVTAQFRVHYLGNARRSEPSSHTLELTSARVLLLHAAEAQASAAPSLRPWF
eukprot:m51a1_g291 hypothetical protein (460) ;mRNA; r:344235-347474